MIGDRSTLWILKPHRVLILLAAWIAMGIFPLDGQTTQGLISGSVINRVTGTPIAGASVTYASETLAATGTLKSDAAGYYFLPLLSAGSYSVRVTADTYQSQELEQLELPVAGRIQIDFRLRPLSDVWEAGQYRSVFLPGSKTIVTFYGPDVDTSRSGTFEGQQGTRGTLDTSVSYVIDPTQIGDLPLQGRDVYTMLVSLPGVTADNGTARGIGVSVAGTRPSSSNFLLDGVSNNNYLVTGPLSPVAPEAVQEYRISTNNYSAEYGQTAGFVANAVTKAGGNSFHGIGYEYIKNTVLDGADFADNLAGYGRLPDKEHQFGYQVGGPVRHDRLFFSSALEQLISHSNESPRTYELPAADFLKTFNVPTSRLASQLLTEFPAPVLNVPGVTGLYTVSQPVVVDRLIALERGDYATKAGRDHIMSRLAIQRLSQPDFIWSPYPAFVSGLQNNTTGIMGNWTHTFTPRITGELKLGFSSDYLAWTRAHPDIPTLTTGADPETGLSVSLPGSPAFYAYKNQNRTFQGIYSTVWTRNRHIVTAGGGVLLRYNSGFLTAGLGGEYIFSGVFGFAEDQPQNLYVTINRCSTTNDPCSATTPVQPSANRNYYYPQLYFFAQDSFRVSSRLTLNYGFRYDNFGGPQNTGAEKDAMLQLGTSGDFNAKLASAMLVQPTSGNQQVFGDDDHDFAGRFGFSWDPFGKSKTVFRGGYGIFYDPPFDNIWQNVRSNDLALVEFKLPSSGSTNYLAPIPSILPSLASQTSAVLAGSNFPNITFMDPKLRNGYAQDAFLGVQQSVGDNLTIEINGTASLGRRLITNDIVNREFTTSLGERENPALPNVDYRSSQGNSDYTALSAIVKYHWRTLQVQGAYTWSHAIDDQSDPLNGDFFNLDFTAITSASSNAVVSSFATQFNNNGDRGSSDFDQRQNLFLLGIWRSEGRRLLTRGWQVSFLAAFRGGFPYTITSPSLNNAPLPGGEVEGQRADLTNPSAAMLPNPVSGPGGVYLLNPAAFAEPANPSVVGNTGRNEFRGPGLYNLDFSLGRSFSVPYLREGTRFTIRADAFNILNHANLNNPDNLLGDSSCIFLPSGKQQCTPLFGLATYGRQGTASGFPAVSPVNETARQIQLLLRIEF
jgi:hypothetical protein